MHIKKVKCQSPNGGLLYNPRSKGGLKPPLAVQLAADYTIKSGL